MRSLHWTATGGLVALVALACPITAHAAGSGDHDGGRRYHADNRHRWGDEHDWDHDNRRASRSWHDDSYRRVSWRDHDDWDRRHSRKRWKDRDRWRDRDRRHDRDRWHSRNDGHRDRDHEHWKRNRERSRYHRDHYRRRNNDNALYSIARGVTNALFDSDRDNHRYYTRDGKSKRDFDRWYRD